MKLFKIFYIFILLICGNAIAKDNKNATTQTKNINFTSDTIEVDEKTKIMTASGNVIITSENRKIRANKVEYDQNLDKAIAFGNVILTEEDGSIYESEKVILKNEFKSIVANPFYGKLIDKSYITATKLEKNDLGESFFYEGVYSACECNVKDNETPIWRIESKKIKHDPVTKTIYIKHPVMKIFSIPIYYVPYLSLPDWTVKRRSGFLTPTFGYSERNKFHTKIPYYYAPENNQTWDMTFTTHQNRKTVHTDQINIRKKYENTSITTNLYKGNLDTNKSDGDNVFAVNLYANSILNNDWKMELVGKYADQKTFMRRYGFDEDTSYKSYFNLSKTRENSISNIEFYNIQNLDETNSNNSPILAPSISHHVFGNNKKYNYDIKLKAHSIYNDESYDIKRWSGFGEVDKKINYEDFILEADANFGLDLYSIQGRPSTDNNNNKYIDRFSTGFSIAAFQQYGFAGQKNSFVLEPKVQFTSLFSTDRTDEVPNRDAAEFKLDEANLFLNNQYQGRDNIQRNDRINAGISSLIMTENFGDVNFFIGQSHKLSGTQKNTATANKDRQSHIINSLNWNKNKGFNVSWFSLYDHHNLKSDTSDFKLNGSINEWKYSANHKSVNGDFLANKTDREELNLSLSKDFSNLNTSYSRQYDLNDGKEELISEILAIEYTGSGYMFGNCLTILLEYKSSGGVSDRDLLPEDSIYLNFNFRNLGDYIYKPKMSKIF